MNTLRRGLAAAVAITVMLSVFCGLGGLNTSAAESDGYDFLKNTEVSGEIGAVIADKATNTFAGGTQVGAVYLDFLNASGERIEFEPKPGYQISYDFEVLSGEAYLYPYLGSWHAGDLFTGKIKSDNHITGGEGCNLPVGHYTGTIAPQDFEWTSGVVNSLFIKLLPNAKLRINRLHFVHPEQEAEDFLAQYSVAGDVGQVAENPCESGKVFTTGEGFGSAILTGPQSAVAETSAVLQYDFTVEMTEHTENDENHAYHGRTSFRFNIADESAASVNELLMNTLAENNGCSLWEGTLPSGEYRGSVDLSSVWNAGVSANGFSLRLNEFTRVTVRKWTVVFDRQTDESTVTDGKLVYTVKNRMNLGIGDMYNNADGQKGDVNAAGDRVYTGKGEFSSWTSEENHDRTVDFTGCQPYIRYHFTVEKGAISLTQNFEDRSVELAGLIAEKHGVALVDGKLPAGSYSGVVRAEEWPTGPVKMKTLSVWTSSDTVFSGRALELLDVEKVIDSETGQPPLPDKAYVTEILPDMIRDWAGDFEERSAVISGDAENGWTLSVPGGRNDASSRVYFDYRSTGENSLLLSYDFTVQNGAAELSLCAGVAVVDGSETARYYETEDPPKRNLSLVSRIAAVAGVKPISNPDTGMLWLPDGTYRGVLCLDDDIPDSFRENGYSWWDCGLSGGQTTLVIREFDLVKNVEASPVIGIPGDNPQPGEPGTPVTPDPGAPSTPSQTKQITDGNVVYTVANDYDLGMTDMYDNDGGDKAGNSSVRTEQETRYLRTGKTGAWISERNKDRTVDFTDRNFYIVYDFTVAKGAVGISQNFNGVSADIARMIASKHRVPLQDGDKLPAGTYRGVLKPSNWPLGSTVMSHLSVWSTNNSDFTVRALRLIQASSVLDRTTGQPPLPQKEYLIELLPFESQGWSMEFEKRNAAITGSWKNGWNVAVPRGMADASARSYFSYTGAAGSSLLLSYDFTIKNGEAGIHLRSGMAVENDKEIARSYSNGKNSLTLTSYIAAAAGVKPIADNTYGEDRLPAGHYQGVICLDSVIPESFTKNGYSWWDCSVVKENASVTFYELAFVKNVPATVLASPKTGDTTPVVPVAALFVLSAAAVCFIYKKCRQTV